MKLATGLVRPGSTDWLMVCIEVWAGLSLLFVLANAVLMVIAVAFAFRRRTAPAGARVLPCMIGCTLPVTLALGMTYWRQLTLPPKAMPR